jgi:hypothetical protein
MAKGLGSSARRTKDLLKLNRDQLRWVVGLLTGHLFKLGLTDESATHILRNCEPVAYLRFRHLEQFFCGTK